MARFWGPAAVLAVQLLFLLPSAVTADDGGNSGGPVQVWSMEAVVDPTYDSSHLTQGFAGSFAYDAIKELNASFARTQGVVEATDATPNAIVLSLPIPGASVTDPQAAIMDVIGRFNYLGPRDPNDPLASDVLGMYGGIEGVAPAPGNPPADLNFFLFIQPNGAHPWVEGGVVIGDTYYRYETAESGEVVVTAYPFEVGLCRLQEAQYGAQPRGPGGWKNMTKADRRAYKKGVKEQKKLGRAQKREEAKTRKELRKEEKEARKGGARRRQLTKLQGEGHGHGHGLAAHAHHDGHAHDDHHEVIHRQLQTGLPLLVFMDWAPPNGIYNPWNGGRPINISQCSLTSAVQNQIISALEEDFAPFNIAVTTSRTAYQTATGVRKVAVNVVRSASGVMGGGNTCGVAYLNSLNWPGNVVWASCECGLAAIPQIAAHEVGHIFSLRHDGQSPNSPYLFGLPAWGVLPANRRWNAIMGGVAPVGIDQWSRGEYTNADNRENDITIITNQVGARPNTVGAPAACTTTLPYRDLSAVSSASTTTYPTATITCGGGSHSYPMRIRGRYAITVTPPAEGNMKFQVAIARAVQRSGQWVPSGSFTVLGTNDAYASTPFTYSSPSRLSMGPYIIRILSINEPGNSNTYPFPVYGSVGRYTFAIRNGF